MIIDGKKIAQELEVVLKKELEQLPEKKVCFILFGNDSASKKFIEMKSRVATRLGIAADVLEVPLPVSTSHAIEVVTDALKEKYDGLVVQLPLPDGVDTKKILDLVPDHVDIDALSSHATKTPPVAQAVDEIFTFHNVDLADKNIVVVGQGELVGKPVMNMLTKKGIKFSVVDKDTDEAAKERFLKEADIIISGAGVPRLIQSSMIKEGVILIDAGTSESGGVLVGDIDPACAEKASLITPVPGGVGPITVVSLFKNLLP